MNFVESHGALKVAAESRIAQIKSHDKLAMLRHENRKIRPEKVIE
jgi:hypothetical protein